MGVSILDAILVAIVGLIVAVGSFDCYGEVDPEACSGPNGTCVGSNDCDCVSGYFGDSCSTWKCNGVFMDDPFVCIGNGQCVSPDNCLCDDGWTGFACHVPRCYGVVGDDPFACNGRGDCVAQDVCDCVYGWSGDECDVLLPCDTEPPGTCFLDTSRNWMIRRYKASQTTAVTTSPEWPYGTSTPTIAPGAFLSTSSDANGWTVVKGFGYTGFDMVLGVVPALWNTATAPTYSFGIDANTQGPEFGFDIGPIVKWVDVSGYGHCDVYDATPTTLVVSLDSGLAYSNTNSQCVGFVVTSDATKETVYVRTRGNSVLNAILVGEPLRGSLLGVLGSANPYAFFVDKETYTDFWMNSSEVNEFFDDADNSYRSYTYQCSDIACNATNVCSEHGECAGPNFCKCCFGYTGSECETAITCDGIGIIEPGVCSGHGFCDSIDHCFCEENYGDHFCHVWKCFGLNNGLPGVCSGHGTCIAHNNCSCDVGYFGEDCEFWDCYDEIDPVACSGENGTCVGGNDCLCLPKHEGSECEDWKCEGILYSLPEVCNGNGQCTQPDNCLCDPGWSDDLCDIPSCFGVWGADPVVCSGRGDCVGLDVCDCYIGWGGEQCRDRLGVCDIAGATNPLSTVNSTYYMQQNFNFVDCGPVTTFSENWHFSTLVGTTHTASLTCNWSPYGVWSDEGELGTLNNILPTGKDIDDFLGAVVEKGVYLRFAPGYRSNAFTLSALELDNGIKIYMKVTAVPTVYHNNIAIFDSEGSEIYRTIISTVNPQLLNVYVYHDGNASYVYLYNEISSEQPTADIYETISSAEVATPFSNTLGIANEATNYYARLFAFGLSLGPVSHSEALTIVQGGMPSYTEEGDYLCFARYGDDPNVCSGNGACIDKDTCQCCPGYEGAECEKVVKCDNIKAVLPEVCSQQGDCIHTDQCLCYDGWYGEWCQVPPEQDCFGIPKTEEASCGTQGVCVAQDTCVCSEDWFGALCDVRVVKCPLCVRDPPCVNGTGRMCDDTCECFCDSGWVGPECDSVAPCDLVDPATCHEHGVPTAEDEVVTHMRYGISIHYEAVTSSIGREVLPIVYGFSYDLGDVVLEKLKANKALSARSKRWGFGEGGSGTYYGGFNLTTCADGRTVSAEIRDCDIGSFDPYFFLAYTSVKEENGTGEVYDVEVVEIVVFELHVSGLAIVGFSLSTIYNEVHEYEVDDVEVYAFATYVY